MLPSSGLREQIEYSVIDTLLICTAKSIPQGTTTGKDNYSAYRMFQHHMAYYFLCFSI